MPQKALAAGGILILTGLVGYLFSAGASPTALIPTGIGVILFGLGLAGKKEDLRKHVMHAAAALALLAVLATVPGAIKVVGLAFGGDIERPLAVASQSLTALVCTWFLVHAVRTFIAARKANA
jgi:hypothetical protein